MSKNRENGLSDTYTFESGFVRHGFDGTDYTHSFTARSFVPHFAQRMSAACVMNGAEGILKGVRKMSHDRLRRAAACQ